MAWWDVFNPFPQTDTTVLDLMKEEAEAAKQREIERQKQLTLGKQAIEGQFGKFDNNFYDSRRNAVLDYYQPQLDDQMKKARDQLTFAFARAGTLKSSMAGQRSADLTKNYDLQKAGLVSNAESDVSALQNTVANQKSSLLAALNATADATAAANQANAQTLQIYNQRPDYSPLGNVFTGISQGIGNVYNAGLNNAYLNAYYGGGGNSGGGGTRTVRS